MALNEKAGQNAMRLFHISEDSGIKQFDPRPSRSSHVQVKGDVVWAVTEAKLYNYILPRDCPRVSFYAQDTTREEDVEQFLDGVKLKKVLVAESGWLPRILSTELVRYEFATDHFQLLDESAGYYLSPQIETPISVETIADPLGRLLADGIEVRLTPSLWELRERILQSTMGFSFIRMNHATPPLKGFEAYFPI